MSFNVSLKRNANRNNILMSAYPLGDAPALGSSYAGLVPDYYVSSTGSDAANGTSEGTAFATLDHAYTQTTAGGVIGVVDDITTDISMTVVEANPGTALNPIVTVAKTLFTKINGRIIAGAEIVNCYHDFRGLLFDGLSATQGHSSTSRFVRHFCCVFRCSGGAVVGNNTTLRMGSFQLYEDCLFVGDAGRYAAEAWQRTNLLVRRPIVRTEQSVWTFDGSNPCAGIQIYSCSNSVIIQPVAVDCLNQGQATGASYLSAINHTTNTLASAGIEFINAIATDTVAFAGIRAEGSNPTDAIYTDCISWRNSYGLIGEKTNINIDVIGGDFSNNSVRGVYGINSAIVEVSNANSFNNPSGNYTSIVDLGGNTQVAPDELALLNAAERIGVSGTYFGETDYKTVQSGQPLFPFTNESEIKTLLNSVNSRGWSASASSLKTYLATGA